MANFPSAYNTIRTFLTDMNTFEKYNVYFMAHFDGHVAVRVPYKENMHMPSNWLQADKSDFYFIVFDNSIADIDACIKASTNTPKKYPESLYARNVKSTSQSTTTTAKQDDDFDKGLAASKAGNYKEAIEWYKKAAAKDNEVAMYNIGILYYQNKTGEAYSSSSVLDNMRGSNASSKRYVEAMKWFKQSADKGYGDAMYALGLMYQNGEGVTADKVEAKKWFQKAADKGNEKAKEKLKMI